VILQRLRGTLSKEDWDTVVRIPAIEIEIDRGPELRSRDCDSAPLATDTGEIQRRTVSMRSDPSTKWEAENKYPGNELEGQFERRSHGGPSQ
jgi:hypothetical protein